MGVSVAIATGHGLHRRMSNRLSRILWVALWVGWVATSAAPAQDATPPAGDTKAKTLDTLPLPPGTVIIVTNQPRDANPPVDAVVLAPDEYRKLLEAAKHLKKLTAGDRFEVPSICRLEISAAPGTDTARVRVQYRFRTEVKTTVVVLGLQKGRPISAAWADGSLPALVSGKDDGGLQVLVGEPGDHQLTIEVDVPLAVRGSRGERVLELGLPGSAITTVDALDLPAESARPRIGGRSVGRLGSGVAFVLGPARSLDVTWEPPPATGDPVTTTEGRIDVRVEEKTLAVTARLHIKVTRGRSGEFRLIAPATARINVEGDTATVESPPENRRTLWLIKRPPSGDDLQLTVQWQQALTRRPLSVAGVPTPGAAVQRGVVTLIAPLDYRLNVTTKGDVSRRDDLSRGESERRESFAYWSLTGNQPLLEFDPQPGRGEIEAVCQHALHLGESGWRLAEAIELKPARQALERVEIEVPAGWQDLRVAPADAAELVGPGREIDGAKIVTMQLAEASRKAVAVTLEALWPLPGGSTAATLNLPRVRGVIDRGGGVTVFAPAGCDLRGALRTWERDRVGSWEVPLVPGRGGWFAAADRAAGRLDMTWRVTGADAPVQSVADVRFGPRQANVRQTFRFAAAPRQVALKAPPGFASRVRIVDGGSLVPAGPAEWLLQPAGSPGRPVTAILDYTFTYSPDELLSAVPLLWAETAAGDTDVRIWPDPEADRLPGAGDAAWAELPIRPVDEDPRLPALALRGTAGPTPLPLRWRVATTASAPVVIERAVVHATLLAGAIAHHVALTVRPRGHTELILDLPAPASAVRRDGKLVEGAGRSTRVVIPLLPREARAPHLVEVQYEMASPRALRPPRLVSRALLGPVRWLVSGPPDRVVLDPAGILASQSRWQWQGGLFAPGPAMESNDPDTAAVTPLLTATGGFHDCDLWAINRGLLTLIVSGSLLLVGWWLLGRRWSSRGLAVLCVSAAVALAAGLMRPQMAAALVAAAEPGMAVLAVASVVAWRRGRSSRPEVVFAPASRLEPAGGSALLDAS